MNSLRHILRTWLFALFVVSVFIPCPGVLGQEGHVTDAPRDSLIAVAREMMESAGYCALITLDHSGRPQVRAMDPFAPEEDMVIWLGTNSKSRKVQEISNDPRVTLYYAHPEGGGYVAIAGTARLVDDPEEKARWWKEEWEAYYPNREDTYLLIVVTPEKLEILSYGHDITGDSETWRTPCIEFKASELED